MTTSPSPASAHSEYFDAPLMRLFSRTKSARGAAAEPEQQPPAEDEGVAEEQRTGAAAEQPAESAQDPDAQAAPLQGTGAADAARSQRVPVPRDPVVKERPADGGLRDARKPDDAPSDSGYGSGAAEHARAASRQSLQSVPVVWAGSPSERHMRRAGGEEPAREPGGGAQRSASVRSAAERASVAPSSVSRRRSRMNAGGGTFASGPGTVGPAATPVLDEGFSHRSATANAALTEKQKSRIMKEQVKEGRQVAKVLKAESKAEQEAIRAAINELADMQKMQKEAVKEESRAYSAHARALRTFHREEIAFYNARAQFERSQAELQAREDAREWTRNHSQEITEMLQDKNREVEWLRAQKVADDRERQARIQKLTG